MSNLDIALACAGRGWRVFPVSIVYKAGGKTEKHPLIPWKTEATDQEGEVRRLWSLHPAAKVGVVTGSESDLYVVDVDDPGAVARQLGEPFETPLGHGQIVQTNRPGGVHYYFSGPEDGRPVSNSQEDGLDVRGDGGMVVCWHEPPEYDLMPLPSSLADWARERTTSRPLSDPSAELETIRWPGGGSDAWVVSMVGSMCRRGFQEVAALAAMLAENEHGRFDPPCDPEWLEMKVHGVYSRYFDPGKAVSSALLVALENLKERP